VEVIECKRCDECYLSSLFLSCLVFFLALERWRCMGLSFLHEIMHSDKNMLHSCSLIDSCLPL
jgi:hypothetical protein